MFGRRREGAREEDCFDRQKDYIFLFCNIRNGVFAVKEVVQAWLKEGISFICFTQMVAEVAMYFETKNRAESVCVN